MIAVPPPYAGNCRDRCPFPGQPGASLSQMSPFRRKLKTRGSPLGRSGRKLKFTGTWKSSFTGLHGTRTKANLARTSITQDVDSTACPVGARRSQAGTDAPWRFSRRRSVAQSSDMFNTTSHPWRRMWRSSDFRTRLVGCTFAIVG
jgi:hypothetical protein